MYSVGPVRPVELDSKPRHTYSISTDAEWKVIMVCVRFQVDYTSSSLSVRHINAIFTIIARCSIVEFMSVMITLYIIARSQRIRRRFLKKTGRSFSMKYVQAAVTLLSLGVDSAETTAVWLHFFEWKTLASFSGITLKYPETFS